MATPDMHRGKPLLELLEAALERTQATRREFLEQHAPPDQLDQLLGMLALAEDATNAMPTSAMAPALPPLQRDRAGEQLGPYRIGSSIGEGGMGQVFQAERTDGVVRQQVAIKIIHHAARSEQARRQFENERQFLADLSHPSIATLLDGGTTADGLPYVVMELVDGQPLNRYLESQQPSFEARLDLFLAVAAGVDFAHRHLIVHRDLKPANILVKEDGSPKLLDFGIAKSMALGQPAAEGDHTAAMLMTPAYASPEQVAGRPAAVTSDVYALGLILYETLTGERFNDFAGLSPAEIERRVTTQLPARASSRVARRDAGLARRLSGDLDAIIGKALALEPERRYETVAALMADVRRFQQGQPVIARGDTLGYRSRKFVGRHWVGVAATALVAISLVTGIIATSLQAAEAKRQRDIATRETATAEEAVAFLQSMLFSAHPWEGDSALATVDDVLAYAETALDNAFADRPQTRVYLLTALAEVFLGRGEMAKGRDYAERAVALAEHTPGLSPARLAGAYRIDGSAHLENGDARAAAAAYQRAAEIFESLETPAWNSLGSTFNDLGATYAEMQDAVSAERYYRRAIEIYERPDVDDPESHSSSVSNLSTLYTHLGRYEEAQRLLARAEALLEEAGAGEAKRAITMGNRAGLLVRLDRLSEAEPLYRNAVELLNHSLGADHPDTVMMMTSLGYFYLRSAQFDRGVPLMATALERAKDILEPDHPTMAYVQNVAGGLYCENGDTAQGIELLRTSLTTRRAAFGEDHWTVASGRSLLGSCLARAGAADEAEPLLKSGYSALAEALGRDDERARVAALRLADLYDQRGDAELAAHYRR
jgi:serine/threonine-protein kinase